MTRVSAYFGLAQPLQFVDVHVDRDNLLFLDPSMIRMCRKSDPLAGRAHDQLVGFMSEVTHLRACVRADAQARGLELLQHLHEPNETRLGMSRHGVGGHGFGAGLGERLWEELRTNVACRAAALTRLEDLALFIDDVGDDLVSDMTTRVIFNVLVEFTRQMMLQFPALTVGATIERVEVWDPTRTAWTTSDVQLPYAAGRQLLLVPKRWVFWRTVMDPDAFYNRFGTATVQAERTTYKDGQRYAPPKWSLREEFPNIKKLNRTQAAKYKQAGEDLVVQYRNQVDQRFAPLADSELDRRTA
ncbi:hypothetical protein BJF90_32045 [Pseudonocardia sp. CNS-004]|nr:hypothetical protein BJF90_32045 [Pseudonocardia sp. CNS-004]